MAAGGPVGLPGIPANPPLRPRGFPLRAPWIPVDPPLLQSAAPLHVNHTSDCDIDQSRAEGRR